MKTFAEYMDSTPDLRARRDRMVAAINEQLAESARRRALAGSAEPGSWLASMGLSGQIATRVHVMTGEPVPVQDWVSDICGADGTWFEAHWAWMDEFDMRVRCALNS
jgi:hypothetical protein